MKRSELRAILEKYGASYVEFGEADVTFTLEGTTITLPLSVVMYLDLDRAAEFVAGLLDEEE